MLNTGIRLFIIVMGFLWIPTASLSLPNCPSDQTERYHNCFGTLTFGPNSEWSGHKYVGEFKDGKMNGLYERYEEGGQLIVKALYKDGEKHGLYEYYQDDGQLLLKQDYKNGKENGFAQGHYPTGQIGTTSYYKDGQLDGLFTLFTKMVR